MVTMEVHGVDDDECVGGIMFIAYPLEPEPK